MGRLKKMQSNSVVEACRKATALPVVHYVLLLTVPASRDTTGCRVQRFGTRVQKGFVWQV
jgi:hypothetical protein